MKLWAPLAQVRGDDRPEVIHPTPDGLVGQQDLALRQQILDISQAEREPQIKPGRLLDDFRRKAVLIFLITNGYRALRVSATSLRRDNAGGPAGRKIHYVAASAARNVEGLSLNSSIEFSA
jgi:hypothetical protein